MKRKLTALALVSALLIITLSSCGSTTDPGTTEENKNDITVEEDIQNVRIEEENGEEVMHITLTFADDTTDDCIVLGTFELDGKEYIALESESVSQKVYVYRYQQDSDDQWSILDIEPDEERDAAFDEFNAIMAGEDDNQ